MFDIRMICRWRGNEDKNESEDGSSVSDAKSGQQGALLDTDAQIASSVDLDVEHRPF